MIANVHGVKRKIFYLLVGISHWMIKKHVGRSELSKQWIQEGFQLTEFSPRKHISCIDVARKRAVLVTYNKGYVWRSQISHECSNTPGSTLDVEVSARTFYAQCPCHYMEEYGQPCIHCMALVIPAKLRSNDKRCYHSRYHTSILGKLAIEELLPPEHKVREKTQEK
jgi:hypothetical protein